MASYALGIDLGTASTKAVLLDEDGHERRVASAPVQLDRPRHGWVEADPADWWASTKSAVRQAVADDAAKVTSIGLSGQMHGMVLVRSDGSPLRPAMLWLDRRAQDSQSAYQALPVNTRTLLGNPFIPGMAAPMLHWTARNEPDVLDAAAFALQAKDWLRLRLTGQAGSEPSDASGTLLFDIFRNVWSQEVVEALGVPARLLAPLSASDATAGHLDARAAAELKLPPGLPVAFGCADTAAALVGTGLTDAGVVQLTVGSGAQVVAPRLQPNPDPALRYHVFASALPSLWYALAAVQAAGIALNWALSTFNVSWDDAYQLLETSPPGANGLTFSPHLAGARSPSMDFGAKAGFFGIELVHGRADMVRAVFEGVAFSIAEAAETLPELGQTSALYLAGGGSTRPQWRQLLSDLLGKHLLVVESPNASPRGAALLGGRAAGFFRQGCGEPPVVSEVQPGQGSHRQLRALFERWLDLTGSVPPSSTTTGHAGEAAR